MGRRGEPRGRFHFLRWIAGDGGGEGGMKGDPEAEFHFLK